MPAIVLNPPDKTPFTRQPRGGCCVIGVGAFGAGGVLSVGRREIEALSRG